MTSPWMSDLRIRERVKESKSKKKNTKLKTKSCILCTIDIIHVSLFIKKIVLLISIMTSVLF